MVRFSAARVLANYVSEILGCWALSLLGYMPGVPSRSRESLLAGESLPATGGRSHPTNASDTTHMLAFDILYYTLRTLSALKWGRLMAEVPALMRSLCAIPRRRQSIARSIFSNNPSAANGDNARNVLLELF